MDRFLADAEARADAGQLEPGSVGRYRSALVRHYLAFAGLPDSARRWPKPGGVDGEFALGLAAFLAARQVSPNGKERAARHQMKGAGFVWDTVRAMYLWAAARTAAGC